MFLQTKRKPEFFGSFAGVKQGEILSPLLFAFYINELEHFLCSKGIQPLSGILNISGEVADFGDYDINYFINLLTLFYADDTIIFAESAIGLQFALEELQNYCEKWKLTVNEEKTKIMCITRGRCRNENYDFIYNGKELECVEEFTYLGICFTKNGLTNKTVAFMETAAKKAMFGFLNRCKKNHLPIEVQLDVFKKTVLPCMLFGGEMWGFNKSDCLEIVQKKFIKYALKLKSTTATATIYFETGYISTEYEIKIKMITFWVNLLTGRRDKFSYKLYLICLSLYRRGLLLFKWMDQIVSILNECGFSYIFLEQLFLDEKYLKNVFLPNIKVVIRNQAIQLLYEKIYNTPSSFLYYPELISFHGIQKYLKNMPSDIWIPLAKLRTSNHKLPVEIYSWKAVFKPREERTCIICNLGEVGDELHYIMKCPVFQDDRSRFLPKTLNENPHKTFINLLKSDNIKELRGLAKFLNVLF